MTIAIIGGGPSAMCLAAHLDSTKYNVTIYERQQSIGRKFLVAGKGGFNLTYDEPIDTFKKKYRPVHSMDRCLDAFTPSDLRAWLDEIGIETYVGTSRRVFPVAQIKPRDVLHAIKQSLNDKGVTIKTSMQWTGWNTDGQLTFGDKVVDADLVVFALGGGSWKVTGSDGSWLDHFNTAEIPTHNFLPVNCGFTVEWDHEFASKFAGEPLKNIIVSDGDKHKTGELLITEYGIEGNAIYAMSHDLQGTLRQQTQAVLHVDLKPMLSVSEIEALLTMTSKPRAKILSDRIKLSKVAIALLKRQLSKEDYLNPTVLAKYIKALPIHLGKPRSLDEAISTIGGVPFSALSDSYELLNLPDHYCIGEMVDWYAPTGGYLLQGCMSMGKYLADQLNSR